MVSICARCLSTTASFVRSVFACFVIFLPLTVFPLPNVIKNFSVVTEKQPFRCEVRTDSLCAVSASSHVTARPLNAMCTWSGWSRKLQLSAEEYRLLGCYALWLL
jgi:hypothetical protein